MVKIYVASAAKPDNTSDVEVSITFGFHDIRVRVKKQGILISSHYCGAGGIKLLNMLSDYVRHNHKIVTGWLSIEAILHDLGSICPLDPSVTSTVRGPDVSGEIKTVILKNEELQSIIAEYFDPILKHIASYLKNDLPKGLNFNAIHIRGELAEIIKLDECVESILGFTVIADTNY